jgi:hypothetical protein
MHRLDGYSTMPTLPRWGVGSVTPVHGLCVAPGAPIGPSPLPYPLVVAHGMLAERTTEAAEARERWVGVGLGG